MSVNNFVRMVPDIAAAFKVTVQFETKGKDKMRLLVIWIDKR